MPEIMADSPPPPLFDLDMAVTSDVEDGHDSEIPDHK